MNDDEELLDLVDSNDKVIGTIRHVDSPSLIDTKAGFIRAVGCFIENSKGQLWTPRRTSKQKIAPNGLDYGASGHVTSGESYTQALVREFKEELSLEAKEAELKKLGILQPIVKVPYFFIAIFLYHAEEIKEYSKTDFSGYEWLYPEEIIKLINAGVPCKDSLAPALKQFILRPKNS